MEKQKQKQYRLSERSDGHIKKRDLSGGASLADDKI
jgi:hypothetical protein